jgi:DNA-directed RNA polymerase subunit RPC12/RpoP
MNKEKQIEDLKNFLLTHDTFDCEQCKECGLYLREEDLCGDDCFAHKEAQLIFNGGYRKIPENIGEFSDGYHTFNELYHHRAVLFSVICNMLPEKAWKSKLHDTGDMFDGMFIVGIETEQGQATYHYDIDPYWDMFKVKELEKAPKWDGHTPSDAIERIGNISANVERNQIKAEWKSGNKNGQFGYYCTNCDACFTGENAEWIAKEHIYCPKCGAKMKGD